MGNKSILYLTVFRSFAPSPLFSQSKSLNLCSCKFIHIFASVSYNSLHTSVGKSCFSAFLSSVFINELSITYNSFLSYSDQVLALRDCRFDSIRSQSATGGAVYCKNVELSICYCVFYYCHATSQAGAFFHDKGSLKLECTEITRCSAVKQTTCGANAFVCNQAAGRATYVSLHLSGPTQGANADSSFEFTSNTTHITYFNLTDCNGVSGGAGGCLRIQTNSYYNYSTVFNCSDHNSVEGWSSVITVFRNNFVHNTRNTHCFLWGQSNTLFSFDACIFINNHKTTLSTANSFTIKNSLSDTPYKSISTTTNIQSYSYIYVCESHHSTVQPVFRANRSFLHLFLLYFPTN